MISKQQYKSTKLSTKFPVKDKTDFQHINTVAYYGKCPSEGCNDNYVGETTRCILQRIKDLNSKYNNPHP